MSKIGDFITDITPSPVYRFFDSLKSLPKERRWKHQRAKGILPECDCWEFHNTLVNCIQQGVKYLLREDGWVNSNGDNSHKKYKKDLEYILNWTYLYEKILKDDPKGSSWEDLEAYKKRFAEYQKVQTKAFKLIDKHLLAMWD